MESDKFQFLLKTQEVVEREGIYIVKEIASKTVWDKLALENPTDAVISARDETHAAAKSATQIADIMQHLKSDDVVLDCGTGYGRVAKYLLPKMSLGGFIGVDSSYEMLTLFKRRYGGSEAEQQTPLLLLNADIHTLPLKDASVDVVLVSAVYLHNHKSIVEKAVTEAKRVLKPGGTMLVYASFPRVASLMGIQGSAYQMLLNLLGRPFKNGPVRYYWRREVLHLFDGFAEVGLRPVGFAVLPKSLIFLPGPLDLIWRKVVANPLNKLFSFLIPGALKYYFAVHFDVVAKR